MSNVNNNVSAKRSNDAEKYSTQRWYFCRRTAYPNWSHCYLLAVDLRCVCERLFKNYVLTINK